MHRAARVRRPVQEIELLAFLCKLNAFFEDGIVFPALLDILLQLLTRESAFSTIRKLLELKAF
jgi:hypothetical protein